MTLTVYDILKIVSKVPDIHIYDKCITNIKKLYCNLIFPRCDITTNQVIFTNSSNCYAATSSCPPVVNSAIRHSELCQNIPTGQFKLDTCVIAPKMHYHNCPNRPSLVAVPKFLILNRLLVDIAASYQVNILKANGASDQCIQKFVNVMCQSVPFCSPDKKSLMTAMTKQTCYNSINW